MRTEDLKDGDIVVITYASKYLNEAIVMEGRKYNSLKNLICQVHMYADRVMLDRFDTEDKKCVLNYLWLNHISLRPATSREKFLYLTYGIRGVE